MSEENTKQIVANINRCGTTLPIVKTEIKRGKNKGTIYYAPDTSNLADIVAWLGEDQLKKLVVPKLMQIAQGWTEESTNEDTNEFDLEAYTNFAQTFSARGESKAALEEQRDELMAQLGDMNSDDMSPENMKEIMSVMKQIQGINQDIASKKRERKAKTEGGNGAATPAPVAATA